ncbi:putative coenzyme Q-binding protein COQ10, START [Dioscorea sansibarensis]
MAAAMVAFIAGPGFLPHFRGVPKQALLHPLRTFFSKPYPNNLFLRSSSNGIRRRPFFIPIGPFSPVMEWQDCSAKLDIDVPCSIAYECYSDRESIPKWMPFISSVKVLKDKPYLSRWSLKYEVLGRDVEFSWLARNMQPIPNQKIHWRSLEGLPNRGAVRFFPKGPSACTVELSISYEVPQILVPVASALKPLLESLLLNGLERFANVAKDYQEKISIP